VEKEEQEGASRKNTMKKRRDGVTQLGRETNAAESEVDV